MADQSGAQSDHTQADQERSRTLVLCFDGTTNDYGPTNTNVVKLFSMLKQDVGVQACYYQAGVGTYFEPGVVSPLLTWVAAITDDAIAWYLSQHIIDGYTFLMQNYHEGDKICLFGFSRGAYTARALAGMLHKVGLLGKDNPEQVPFAYKLYKRTDRLGIELAAGFKQTFSRSVPVEFIGVWDTVASVGLIINKRLPFDDSNTSIKTFRQALALDEHRTKFLPNPYHQSAAEDVFESPVGAPEVPYTTDVLEVWFAGTHSDVGGGSVPDRTEHSLAGITLRWMVREIMTSKCDILFDEAALKRYGIDPETFAVSPIEASQQELAMDEIDAVQPIYDPLLYMPLWWILELLPIPQIRQEYDGRWVHKWSIHFGRGRKIPLGVDGGGPLFHISVKERMEDKRLNYKPRAMWRTGTESYVQ